MNEVVIKPSLREQFLRVGLSAASFSSAPCGFGKSTAATALLSNHKICVFSAENPEFLREPVPKKCRCDCDRFPARAQRPGRSANALRMDPRKSGAALRHFKPRRAARLSSCRSAFTGLLKLIEARDLLFDRDTVRVFSGKEWLQTNGSRDQRHHPRFSRLPAGPNGAFAPDAKQSALYAGDRRHCAAGNLSLL